MVDIEEISTEFIESGTALANIGADQNFWARNTFYPIKNKNFVYLDEAVSDEYRSTKVRIDTIAGDNLRKRIIERLYLLLNSIKLCPWLYGRVWGRAH